MEPRGPRIRIRASVSVGLLLISLFQAGTAGATSFEPDTAIPLPGQMSAFGIDAAIAGDESRVAWYGQVSSGFFQVGYASLSLRNGTLTSALMPFVDAISTSLTVRVAALPAGGFAYAWLDVGGTVWIALGDGTSWRGPVPTLTTLPDPSAGFDLAASADWIYLAWVEENVFNGALVVSRVSLQDLYSKAETRVDEHLTARKADPSLALFRGEPYVAWRRYAGNESAVFFARQTGGAWSSAASVTRNLDRPYEFRPQVALSLNGTVGVLWQDRRGIRDGTGDIRTYLSVERPLSTVFEPAVDLGALVGATYFDDATFAISSVGDLRAVWLDGDAVARVRATRVMYAESNANWSAFTVSVALNSDISTASRDPPVIALGPKDRALVAWGDRRDGGPPRPYVVVSSVPRPPPPPPAWWPYEIGLALTGGGALVGAGGYVVATWLDRRIRGNRGRKIRLKLSRRS